MSPTSHKLATLAIAMSLASSAFAQTGSPSSPPSQKPSAQETKDLAARDMKMCMDAWDSQTQMSKVEWKATCKRTLKEKYYLPDDELEQQ